MQKETLSMFSRFLVHLRSIASNRAGNVAMIFALAAVPLMGSVGLAVDYGSMLSVKAKLDQAADAAAIAGVTGTQTYLIQYNGSGSPTAAAIAAGEAEATAQFNANKGTLPNGTLTINNISITRSGSTLTGSVSYTFSMPTFFMAVLGRKTMTFSGSSTSTVTMPTYINIYIVIDNSSSMGIGATAADQQIVYNATKTLKSNDAAYACAIACHYASSNSTDTTAMVRSAGASLRIDAAKAAVSAALGQIPTGSTIQVAIYTMSNGLTNVYPLSNNITAALAVVAPSTSNAASIDLANDNNDGGTDTTYALKTLNSALPTPGDGLTQATALGYVMLITDAVQDSDMKTLSWGNYVDKADPNFKAFSPCNQSTCWDDPSFGLYFESFDPTQCTPLKTKGYTMMTLDVTYLIPSVSLQSSSSTLNAVFTYIQTYLLNSIPANMTACATSSQYAFSANTPSEITAATAAMFASIPAATQARLSQ
jgi:Flp pilus assembly protein TadG